MAYLLSAGYALFAVVATSFGVADDGETSISQMPPSMNSPAFVEQLPETAVVPVPGADVEKQRPKKTIRKVVAKHAPPVHSIFPTVGGGVNVEAGGTPAVHLPTVGGGATLSL